MAYLAQKKFEGSSLSKKGLLSQKKIEGSSVSKKIAYSAKKTFWRQ